MICLLDTCTFLWLTDRTEELSAVVRETLEDGGNDLVFSQVSAIEIQIKFSKGKLPLYSPPEAFIRESLEKHGITFLPLRNDAIWTTGKLPPLHHDPFDRLLIAQAINEGMALVTPDPRIHSYPVRAIW